MKKISFMFNSQNLRSKFLIYILLFISQIGIWSYLFYPDKMRYHLPLNVIVGSVITLITVVVTYISNIEKIESIVLFLVLILNATLLLIGDFSYFYWNIGLNHNWSIPLSHLDAIYVAVGVLTTAGANGINAISEPAKSYLLLQNIIDFSLFTTLFGLTIRRFSRK